MKEAPSNTRFLFAFLVAATFGSLALAGDWSWQQPQAKVLPNGDLEWAPKPFVFEKGASVRYIDYENGKDSNSGTSKDSAWKHQPWDANATGKAKAGDGVHTYVFKGGVEYRGALTAKGVKGTDNDPIRLTRDPSWGKGAAVLMGSINIGGSGWEKATAANSPKGMPLNGGTWTRKIGKNRPWAVWFIDGSKVTRLELARIPNWTIKNFDDVKSEWWEWEKDARVKKKNGGIDTKNLTESPDFYKDALVYTEWGIVMCTPAAVPVKGFDPKKKALFFEGFFTPRYVGRGMSKGMRYYLANKPQYLDVPGEWYVEKDRIYLKLPGNADPKSARIEMGMHKTLIDLRDISDIEISGLEFRYTDLFEFGKPGFSIYEDDHETAGVRMQGNVRNAVVKNNHFIHTNCAFVVDIDQGGGVGEDITFSDNLVEHQDYKVVHVENSSGEHKLSPNFKEGPPSRINGVKILRNKSYMTGFKPKRGGHGHSFSISFAESVEIAGNIIDKPWGSGIFAFGGKKSGDGKNDRPFARFLIHHNKVTDSLLQTNDWGGIETWQGGPMYVYNNISGNPGGYRHWRWLRQKDAREDSIGHVGTRFGHAYYLDGGFKNYHFNNIAWGKNNDLRSPLMNTAAFQEIHSYQNTFFNNTAYRFGAGTRRQSPDGGRNLYLGNIWQNISDWVFYHSQGKKAKEVNQFDAKAEGDHFPYETIGYANNVFFDIKRYFGKFEAGGIQREGVDDMAKALEKHGAYASNVGKMAEKAPLRNPDELDFRPTPGSAVIDRGVKVFVPWSLYGTVGEWNFHRNNRDPEEAIDDHWYMSPLHNDRGSYHSIPNWSLYGEGLTASDYVRGELEDWTDSVLKLSGSHYLKTSLPTAEKAMEARKAAGGETTSKEGDWLVAKHPKILLAGSSAKAVITLNGAPEGHQVNVQLHCRKHKGWGGLVNKGPGPKPAKNGTPITFEFPEVGNKGGLKEYVLLVYVSPDGGWKTHIKKLTARITVPTISSLKTALPDQFRTPDVDKTNLLIEAHFRTKPGATGLLAGKMADAGYDLAIASNGGLRFTVKGKGASATCDSSVKVNDGKWHHAIAETDRAAKTLTIYVDGKKVASSNGIDRSISLSNGQELLVGKKLAVALDFLRICRGNLADSRTSIEELYDWQFNGPQLRDFTGAQPKGKRDAGAIELK